MSSLREDLDNRLARFTELEQQLLDPAVQANGGKMAIVLEALPHELMAIAGASLGAFVVANSLGNVKKSGKGMRCDVLYVSGYALMREPIPNAGVRLQAIDEAAPPKADSNVQLAQFYYHHHHHNF